MNVKRLKSTINNCYTVEKEVILWLKQKFPVYFAGKRIMTPAGLVLNIVLIAASNCVLTVGLAETNVQNVENTL